MRNFVRLSTKYSIVLTLDEIKRIEAKDRKRFADLYKDLPILAEILMTVEGVELADYEPRLGSNIEILIGDHDDTMQMRRNVEALIDDYLEKP